MAEASLTKAVPLSVGSLRVCCPLSHSESFTWAPGCRAKDLAVNRACQQDVHCRVRVCPASPSCWLGPWQGLPQTLSAKEGTSPHLGHLCILNCFLRDEKLVLSQPWCVEIFLLQRFIPGPETGPCPWRGAEKQEALARLRVLFALKQSKAAGPAGLCGFLLLLRGQSLRGRPLPAPKAAAVRLQAFAASPPQVTSGHLAPGAERGSAGPQGWQPHRALFGHAACLCSA